ncbi:intein-containing Rv2578c family radical SAM protein [Rhizomonospora bruguierae]|uniref:intein-containing Rv2578c family radical SAM protein n=1 Tax=Rhizomonospora bruguierae TaxID=1581705 RepID=UPI001BCED934|nr:intein-containing Rv2578c family radical SAM protein [Micromonospora sp. NBRC 107566]
MRWSNLSVELPGPEAAPAAPPAPLPLPLPLSLPGAVARTFDTPGFAGMTFYEVRAKSIINRVPGASRVPFEWTVNPYRGCSHACTYCLAGDTPVLMADGRTRPLGDLRVGDPIVGTATTGGRRRYVTTHVRAHWQTVKPAYRVTLADGTRLISSPDHRLLTTAGWRHVAATGPATDGPAGSLEVGDRLLGTGGFAEPVKESAEYRRGYLSGLIRAAGALGDGLRLPLRDPEVLHRARGYLLEFGIPTNALLGEGRGRPLATLATDRAFAIAALRRLLAAPRGAARDWHAGLLAGALDAGALANALGPDRSPGGPGGGAAELSGQLTAAARRLMLRPARSWSEPARSAGEATPTLREALRLRHLINPASRWGPGVQGAAVPTDPGLEVAAIEPLGIDLPLYDITTGTGDFIADGVVSHNCFARNTHTYLDLDAGRDFDTRVVVKVNAGELLRRELAAPRWRGGPIAMGTNVDCYQRAEGRYRLMPQIIAALRDFANPFSILTKGTLILRDLPLLRQAAAVTRVGIAVSVGFVDEALWRGVEPGTPSPRRRLEAVRTLAEAGFDVGVLMAPILPGLTDDDAHIDATVAAIAAAGAASVTPLPLHLRPGAREWYAAWLARHHPALVPRYRDLYGRGSYAPQAYQREVAARVRMAARRHGLGERGANAARDVAPSAPGPAVTTQLTLL